MSAIRKRFVTESMKWPPRIGPAPKGVDHLMNMYQQVSPRLLPAVRAPWPKTVRDAVRSALAKGMWINRRPKGLHDVGTKDREMGIHWCGIFAAWVLQQSGLKVTWTGKGITAPGNTIRKIPVGSQRDVRKNIEAGDICVHGGNQHHFIVIGEIGENTLLTIEGNVRNQEVLRREEA